MAILAECPQCHRKQKVKNKRCVNTDCQIDLDKAKRSGKVHYWLHYRTASGKQRWEFVKDEHGRPAGIKEATAAEGKRKAQKVENPTILERAPGVSWTFNKLTEWYLDLPTVNRKASFERIKGALANFNEVFGEKIIGSIKPLDLENYQEKREEDGRAPATIDMELVIAKAMVNKAFDNDLVDGRTLKAFRVVKRKLKRGSNARSRTISVEEFCRLVEAAPAHLKAVLTIAYNTGMRTGEILNLKWSYIDREHGVVRLPAEVTKESRPKVIPINHNVKKVLAELPRAIHHDAVISFRNKPINDRIRTAFVDTCRKVGIPHGRKYPDGLTFHDIRGTVKTNMLRAGVDKEHRDVILGHSLKGMDVHYLRLSEEDLHQAMSKYTAWLDAQFADVSHSVNNVSLTI